MNAKISWEGVWTALVTPFLEDGSLDEPSFLKLCEEQIQAGISGVFLAGTTGECPTLSLQEKCRLVAVCKQAFPDFPVILGIGSSSTAHSLELCRQSLSQEHKPDGFMANTPAYNKPSEEGLIAHFAALKKEMGDSPLCFYHVPGRTGQKLTAASIDRICQEADIQSIKEASADMCLFADLTTPIPDYTLLSGDDFTFLPSLSLNAAGIVSVVSNLVPAEMVKIYNNFKAGKTTKAFEQFASIYPLIHLCFQYPNPCPAKEILSLEKRIQTHTLRLPLVPVPGSFHPDLQACLNTTRNQIEKSFGEKT